MALPLDDFIRRITGQPMSLPGAVSPSAPVNAPTPTVATVAAPTMQQTQQQDFNNAMLGRMGQLGMMLVAAGQRMTPRERATILAQAPQYMDGVQADMANAAQARLMATRAQQEQIDQARQAAIDAKLSDPKFLAGLGLKPEMAEALGSAGVRKLLENQALANTPDAILNRQRVQAEINHLNAPAKASDPYTDTMNRERAQFDARMEQGKKLNLQGEDLTQFASTGKIQTANEKQTQDQANAALFSRRMDEANQIISNPDIQKYGMGVRGTMNRANAAIPIIGNAFLDPQYQQFDQAKRDFINAVMRRESGAKIDPTEFDNADKQYFPQVGDSDQVLRQKEANRSTAIKGIYDAAAPQYRRTTPLGASQPASAPSAQNAPKQGDVIKGYRFKGGNPADRNSWEPAQ